MKKRIFFPMLLALCLLLVGCADPQTPPRDPEIVPTVPAENAPAPLTSLLTLCLPSVDGSRLITRETSVILPDGQQPLRAALVELLAQESAEIMPLFGGGASLASLVCSRDVLLVDVRSPQEPEALEERLLFSSAEALVETAAANSPARYVVLRINGQALSPRGMLSMPMTTQTDDLETLWIRHQYDLQIGKITSNQANRQILFYTDADGHYLLAEAAEPADRDGDRLDGLFRQLLRPDGNAEGLTSAVPAFLSLAREPRLQLLESGQQILSVWFSADASASLSAEQAENLAAAVTLTAYCTLPDVDAVSLYVNDRPLAGLSDAPLPCDLFLDRVADQATLYFPRQQTGKLVAVERAVSQEEGSRLYARVAELMRGPLAGEDAALDAVFPAEMEESDLLEVQRQGRCAMVNFSSAFRAYYPTDAARERLFLYALVNTLTEESDIDRVRFLVEGQAVGALGRIDLSNPLIRNPGLNADP